MTSIRTTLGFGATAPYTTTRLA